MSELLKRLRKRTGVTYQEASDDELLKAVDGTLLLASIKLSIAMGELVKAISGAIKDMRR